MRARTPDKPLETGRGTEIEPVQLEEKSRDRFADARADVPEPTKPGVPGRGTASELAFDEQANTTELNGKVSTLVASKFGGDYKKAFQHYGGADGTIDRNELMTLLGDADVGSLITRGAWASGVIAKMDSDGDGRISWEEFEKVSAGATA